MTQPLAPQDLRARLLDFFSSPWRVLAGRGPRRPLMATLAGLAALQMALPAPPPSGPQPGDTVEARMERIFHASFCSTGRTDVPIPDAMRPLLQLLAEAEIRHERDSAPGGMPAPALPTLPGAPAPAGGGAPSAPVPTCPCGGSGAALTSLTVQRRRPKGGAATGACHKPS